MPTKIEASLHLIKIAREMPDDMTRNSILVCVHHTLRRKMQQDRNRAARSSRGLPVYVTPPFAVPTVPPVPTSSPSDSSASPSTTPPPAED